MYNLLVRQHIVFAREFLPADGTGEHFDVHFVRGHVMPAEVTDVRVDTVAHRASVNIVLFAHAKIARRLIRIADLLRRLLRLNPSEGKVLIVDDDFVLLLKLIKLIAVGIVAAAVFPLFVLHTRIVDVFEELFRIQLDIHRLIVCIIILAVILSIFAILHVRNGHILIG